MLAIVLNFIALAATLVGGWLVLRFRGLSEELLAFSAGTLLSVALLDLLPHGLQVLGPLAVLSGLAGYLFLHLWHRIAHLSAHTHTSIDLAHLESQTSLIGALALIVHKLVDGVILGLGLAGGLALGLGVAAAVILHSFCDGINTVTIVLRARNNRPLAVGFLLANALAPLVATFAVAGLQIPVGLLDWLLTFVAGTFVYVALHDLLPGALPGKNQVWSLGGSLCAGIGLTWGMLSLLGG